MCLYPPAVAQTVAAGGELYGVLGDGAHPPTANVAGYFGNSKALSNINDKQPETDSERSFPQAFLLPGPVHLLSNPHPCASS